MNKVKVLEVAHYFCNAKGRWDLNDGSIVEMMLSGCGSEKYRG